LPRSPHSRRRSTRIIIDTNNYYYSQGRSCLPFTNTHSRAPEARNPNTNVNTHTQTTEKKQKTKQNLNRNNHRT
jgi:hypothetical protein